MQSWIRKLVFSCIRLSNLTWISIRPRHGSTYRAVRVRFLTFASPRSFFVARIDRQFVAFGVEIMVGLFDRQFCAGHFVS